MEDSTGKLRLYKCKGMASLSAARKPVSSAKPQFYQRAVSTNTKANTEPDDCDCDFSSYRPSTLKKKPLLSKKSKQFRHIRITLETYWDKSAAQYEFKTDLTMNLQEVEHACKRICPHFTIKPLFKINNDDYIFDMATIPIH